MPDKTQCDDGEIECIGDAQVRASHAERHDGPTTYDTRYNSRKADLLVVSKDMVHFKVKSKHLTEKCQFIKNLLEVPSDEPLDKSPIYIDHSTPTIRLFVDLVHSDAPVSVLRAAKPTCLGYESLYEMCDQFEAPDIAKIISRALRWDMRNGLDPWRVFRMAARQNDVEFARAAAVQIHKRKFGLGDAILRNSPSFFDGIPSRYMAALIRSAMKPLQQMGPEESVPVTGWIQRSAKEIGESFSVE